jgi:hypothetical protein
MRALPAALFETAPWLHRSRVELSRSGLYPLKKDR